MTNFPKYLFKWLSTWFSTVLFLCMAALAVALTGYAVSSAMIRLNDAEVFFPSVVLPVILILSVSIVLIILASMTAVFSSLNLANRTHALGMPEGSVRAVIALSLIFIFITTAIYLYGEADGDTRNYNNITQSQLDDIPSSEIVQISAEDVDGVIVYDVIRRVEITSAEKELAIQILTTVSTLVVAIAGFYFGSKSVAVARRVPAPELPVLFNIIEPEKWETGKRVEIRIKGRNLASVEQAKLELNGHSSVDPVTTHVPQGSNSLIKCIFTLVDKNDKPIEVGKWDLVVEDTDGNQARLPDAFEVIEVKKTKATTENK